MPTPNLSKAIQTDSFFREHFPSLALLMNAGLITMLTAMSSAHAEPKLLPPEYDISAPETMSREEFDRITSNSDVKLFCGSPYCVDDTYQKKNHFKPTNVIKPPESITYHIVDWGINQHWSPDTGVGRTFEKIPTDKLPNEIYSSVLYPELSPNSRIEVSEHPNPQDLSDDAYADWIYDGLSKRLDEEIRNGTNEFEIRITQNIYGSRHLGTQIKDAFKGINRLGYLNPADQERVTRFRNAFNYAFTKFTREIEAQKIEQSVFETLVSNGTAVAARAAAEQPDSFGYVRHLRNVTFNDGRALIHHVDKYLDLFDPTKFRVINTIGDEVALPFDVPAVLLHPTNPALAYTHRHRASSANYDAVVKLQKKKFEQTGKEFVHLLVTPEDPDLRHSVGRNKRIQTENRAKGIVGDVKWMSSHAYVASERSKSSRVEVSHLGVRHDIGSMGNDEITRRITHDDLKSGSIQDFTRRSAHDLFGLGEKHVPTIPRFETHEGADKDWGQTRTEAGVIVGLTKSAQRVLVYGESSAADISYSRAVKMHGAGNVMQIRYTPTESQLKDLARTYNLDAAVGVVKKPRSKIGESFDAHLDTSGTLFMPQNTQLENRRRTNTTSVPRLESVDPNSCSIKKDCGGIDLTIQETRIEREPIEGADRIRRPH